MMEQAVTFSLGALSLRARDLLMFAEQDWLHNSSVKVSA